MSKRKDEKNNGLKEEDRQRLALTFYVSLAVMCITVITAAIVAVIVIIPVKLGVFDEDSSYSRSVAILIVVAASVFVGLFITYFLSKIPLRPVNDVIRSVKKLAGGDYSERIHFSKTLSRHPDIKGFADSFNSLATELENTEMLRSDFINNFSHEFKTPIVSIAGFAKLLKKGNLSEEQQKEYLNIIEEESLRLSSMATNVLALTKIENQSILTDVSRFNLSEQIRNCVLLLESKWSKKNIDMDVDFDEFDIRANSEILKEVWINLIDNAIKFTDDFGTIKIAISETDGKISVRITNTGVTIPPEKIERIFNKFYQADEAHSSMGNGVGLAIVKKAVSLHSGKVSVESGNEKTTFTVILPKEQKK